jgi:hypothetical protein
VAGAVRHQVPAIGFYAGTFKPQREAPLYPTGMEKSAVFEAKKKFMSSVFFPKFFDCGLQNGIKGGVPLLLAFGRGQNPVFFVVSLPVVLDRKSVV